MNRARSDRAHKRIITLAVQALERMPCSLRELGAEAGMSAAALSRYRSGDRGLRYYHAKQILGAIEVMQARYIEKATQCEKAAAPLRKALARYDELMGENPLVREPKRGSR